MEEKNGAQPRANYARSIQDSKTAAQMVRRRTKAFNEAVADGDPEALKEMDVPLRNSDLRTSFIYLMDAFHPNARKTRERALEMSEATYLEYLKSGNTAPVLARFLAAREGILDATGHRIAWKEAAEMANAVLSATWRAMFGPGPVPNEWLIDPEPPWDNSPTTEFMKASEAMGHFPKDPEEEQEPKTASRRPGARKEDLSGETDREMIDNVSRLVRTDFGGREPEALIREQLKKAGAGTSQATVQFVIHKMTKTADGIRARVKPRLAELKTRAIAREET